MKFKLVSLAILGLSLSSLSGAQVSGQPACQFSYTFTNRTTEFADGVSVIALTAGAARAPAINNRQQNCNSWLLQLSVDGLTASSVEIDDSQNAYTPSGGTPNAWAAWQGSVLSGTNPTTSFTTSTLISVTGFYPWISVNVNSSTGTGNIYATLYGWRTPNLIGQSFTPLLQFAPGTCLSGDGTAAHLALGNCTLGNATGRFLALNFTNGNGSSGIFLSGVSGADVMIRANSNQNFDVRNDGHIQIGSAAMLLWNSTNSATLGQDTGIERVSAGVIGLNNGTAGAGGSLSVPGLKSTTGTRYICINTTGLLSSSASACSGT